MFGSNVQPFGRGEYADGVRVPADVQGGLFEFKDILTATSNPRSGREVLMRLVKNDSGGELLPGRGVAYKATGADNFGKVVGGYSGAGEKVDGVVDWTLPSAGVPDGKWFWMAVPRGPVYVVSDGASTLARGDILKTAASGKFTKDSATPATNGKAGYCEDVSVTNVDGTNFWMELTGA